MPNITKPYTSGAGATTVNLMTILRALGWSGNGRISLLKIFNPDAALIVYIHLTDQGTTGTAPATPTDGWPIGSAAGSVAKTFEFDLGAPLNSIDLNTVWLSFTAATTIKIMASGS